MYIIRKKILFTILTSFLLFLSGAATAILVSYMNTLKIQQIKYLSEFAIYGIIGFILYKRKIILRNQILYFIPILIIIVFFGIVFNTDANIFIKIERFFELIFLFLCFSFARISANRSGKFKTVGIILVSTFACLFTFVCIPFLSYKSVTLLENDISYKKISQLNLIDENDKLNIFNSNYLNHKTVFLEFWYSSCPPCLAKMSPINTVANNFKLDSNIVFFIVNVGSIDSYERFSNAIKQIPYDLNFMYDKGGITTKELGVKNFPTEIILQKGKIVHSLVGYDRGTGDYFYQKNLTTLISNLIKK